MLSRSYLFYFFPFLVVLQELSKIAMPVVFNEPLSFLQRISEYMEHTHLIHQACSLSDSIDRMQVDKITHVCAPELDFSRKYNSTILF